MIHRGLDAEAMTVLGRGEEYKINSQGQSKPDCD